MTPPGTGKGQKAASTGEICSTWASGTPKSPPPDSKSSAGPGAPSSQVTMRGGGAGSMQVCPSASARSSR